MISSSFHQYIQVEKLHKSVNNIINFKLILFSPRANGWGFSSDFLGEVWSLRQIIFDNEAIVENVAGTTLDKIAPTKDLFLSSESLYMKKYIYI